MVTNVQPEAIKDAPKELIDCFDKAVESLSPSHREDTLLLALSSVRRAGWYRTQKGWHRLGPDVRDKINIRKATRQPDDTYVITDVDVFYPNAVKGSESSDGYDVERISQVITNTNTSINRGGQPPALALGHPHMLNKVMGKAPMAYGKVINWRSSPKGKGWVRCDMINVDSKVVEDWKQGRYTGLSVGFAQDAGELNTRFGHVALLGVESQALASLPTVELFSVDSQLCFSVEPSTFMKGLSMNKDKACAYRDAYSGLSAAFASAASGEIGSAGKVREATSKFSAVQKQFGSFTDDDNPVNDDDAIDKMLDEENDDEKYTTQEPQEDTYIPDAALSDDTTATGKDDDLELPAATSDRNFSAAVEMAATKRINAILGPLVKEHRSAIAKLNDITTATNTNNAKTAFSAQVEELIEKGHTFSSEQANKMFDAVKGDPEGISMVMDFLKSTSIKDTPKRIFSDDSALNPTPTDTSKVSDEEVLAVLNANNKHGKNFTADDLKLA